MQTRSQQPSVDRSPIRSVVRVVHEVQRGIDELFPVEIVQGGHMYCVETSTHLLPLTGCVEADILRKDGDPDHAQKAIYSLTEMGVDLLPILAALSVWSQKHDPTTRRPEAAKLLQGGTNVLRHFEAQLRSDHGLG